MRADGNPGRRPGSEKPVQRRGVRRELRRHAADRGSRGRWAERLQDRGADFRGLPGDGAAADARAAADGAGGQVPERGHAADRDAIADGGGEREGRTAGVQRSRGAGYAGHFDERADDKPERLPAGSLPGGGWDSLPGAPEHQRGCRPGSAGISGDHAGRVDGSRGMPDSGRRSLQRGGGDRESFRSRARSGAGKEVGCIDR